MSEKYAKQPLKRRLSNEQSLQRTSRGGSWRTKSNISDRQIIDPDSCNGYTGFRIVRTYKPIEINKRPDK